MEARIEILPETKLIGQGLSMSFAVNKTKELWQGFMPRRKEIENQLGTELYSVEIYDGLEFFKEFNPHQSFEKWAAVQVDRIDAIPNGMESLTIPEGLYAVFQYKGKASEGAKAYQYIFSQWIPNSAYELDDRPHFALMGEKYSNEDPNSEEELWIPIRKK